MKFEVQLGGTLLQKREQEWAHYLAQPQENPLIPDKAGRLRGENQRFTLQNDLCVYSQLEPQYAEGLLHSGVIVTRRPCETVFDLTPEEAAAVHACCTKSVSIWTPPFGPTATRWAGMSTRRAGSTSRTFTCTSFRAGIRTRRQVRACGIS